MSTKDPLTIIKSKIGEMKGVPRDICEDDYIDFRGAGLNSIELLTLIVYLEEYLGVEVDDEDLALNHFVFIKDLVNLANKHIASS